MFLCTCNPKTIFIMKTLILQEADLTALYDCLKELRSEITELRRMKEPPEHRYLSRSEVCDLLHISYSTLHRMTRQGEIRCLKTGDAPCS